MKKINLFAGLILVILFVTNCKKDDITPIVKSNKPVIEDSWKPFVGTWNLVKETNPQGIQQNLIVNNGYFIFNEDLSESSNWIGGNDSSTIWMIVNNNEFHIRHYTLDYKSIIMDWKFTIISVSSTTLILSNLSYPPYGNPNTFTFQKQ